MKVSLSPNPTGPGTIKLNIDKNDQREEINRVRVEIISAMGKIVFSGDLPCEGYCDAVPLDITDKFTPGVYIVNGVINNRRFSRRLLVR